MSDFKISTYELNEILFDAKKYIEKISFGEDVSKSWFNMKQLCETLDYITSKKNDLISSSDIEFYNKLVEINLKLKTAMENILLNSDKTSKIKELDTDYNKKKLEEKQNQDPKQKRLIEKYWIPYYNIQTKSIDFRDHYYDGEGYLIQINKDGIRERKDIRLADINFKSR